MNHVKTLLLFLCATSCTVTHAMQPTYMAMRSISREEALSKMPPHTLFPHIEDSLTYASSSITYNKNKPHYTIKLPNETLYSDVVAVHRATSQFAMEGHPINSLRSLIVGSLSEGYFKKSIKYAQNMPIKELKFSPDGKKIFAINENKAAIFFIPDDFVHVFPPFDTPISSFCFNTNSDQIAISFKNNYTYLFTIPSVAEVMAAQELSGCSLNNSKRKDHHTLEICFGPNIDCLSEHIEINQFEAMHTSRDSSENRRSSRFEFNKKNPLEGKPLFNHIKQIYNVDQYEYIVVTKEDTSGLVFHLLKFTEEQSQEKKITIETVD